MTVTVHTPGSGRAGEDGRATGQPLSAEARAIAERCAPRVNALAREMVDAAGRDPRVRQLSAHVLDIEMADTARQGIRVFLGRLTGRGRRSAAAFHRVIAERAARRADEGLPLDSLVRGQLHGGRMLWQSLREFARPGEEAALLELADSLFGALGDTVPHTVAAYQRAGSAPSADDRLRRRGLLRALLTGDGVPTPGWTTGFGTGGGWLVLAINAGVPCDPDSGRHGGTPSARPGAGPERAVERELEAALDVPAVAVLLDDGVVRALVRTGGPEDGASEGLLAGLPQRLGRALDAPVHIAVSHAADHGALASAAQTSAETLRIVCLLERPPGLYRIGDVLLEYQLSRPGESTRALAGVLDPLFERPELLETVRTYLAEEQNRKATAKLLRLHPNTVDNRLARCSELLGTDVTTPAGVVLISTALTVRRLLPPA
ncbi:helix-turn-helix domain-containing protein [Streptomyces sp. NPDC051453]|uniref:PucR family transcriptional regulator n=1 Tax=Streptomyces sp. NPDC051453 TaxID=3154941 RepID=UPI0034256DE8